jgi:hypothetical protein
MPDTCDVPVISTFCDTGKDVVSGIASSFIDSAAQSFAQAFAKLTTTVLTFWVQIDVPNIDTDTGPVAFIRNSTSWVTGLVLILGLMVAGARMAITQKFEPGVDAARGLWQMALYTGAGIPAVALLGVAGDQFAAWIINKSAGGDLGIRLGTITELTQLNQLGAPLVLIVALLGILSDLAQIALMIVRVGMLILLAGVLPFTAAGAIAKGGKASLAKTLGWLLAWAAYKPAAAIVYAAAFAITGQGKDPITVLSGLFLLALSIIALPALMRLVVPLTAAIASGAVGAGAGAIAAAGAAATGAIQMRASVSGSSGAAAGAGRPGGPNGATGPGGSNQPGRNGTRSPVGTPSGTGPGNGVRPAAPVGGGGGGHPVMAVAQAGVQGIAAARNAANKQADGPTGAGEA